MRIRMVIAALLLTASGAAAAGYDDYSSGVNAGNIGNYDLAIASFTASLSAGDLAPAYVPNAYFGRAQAYMQKQQYALAVADLDRAITLRPNYADALRLRADAHMSLNEAAQAIDDLTAAIALTPKIARPYAIRASLEWILGRYSAAALDFAQSAQFEPKESLNALWYALSALRAGTFDPATYDAAVAATPSDWPRPILDLFRNKATVEDVNRAAARDEVALRKCEAALYIGEWHLLHKNSAAKALFEEADTLCQPGSFERQTAKIELWRMQQPNGG